MDTFKNKVVWITGASSGIGEALVREFASEGAKLVISARRTEELQRLKSSLKIADQDVLIVPFDLADTTNVDQLTKNVIAQFGKIDILINNGGISQRSLVMDTPLTIDRKIMEVNFFGTIALTKSILPYMLKQNSGNFVVISSIAGKFGFFYRSTYSASKHALHGFFESLRMETYKNNINVLLVCPGRIKTNISINALTGDGIKHNKMDDSHVKGLSAEACAQQILKGIKNNKEEILIGNQELRAVWIKRFFPKLFSKLIRKQKPD